MTKSLKNVSKGSLFLGIDLLAFYSALIAAFSTRSFLDTVAPGPIPFTLPLSFFLNLWWIPLVFVFFIAYERLYVKNLSFWDETRELLKAVTVSLIGILAILTIGRMNPDISRLTVILLWFYGLIIFPFFRHFGKKVIYRFGYWNEHVIILGAGKAGVETAAAIQAESHLGYSVVGFLDDDEQKIGTMVTVQNKQYKVFGKIRNFRKFVKMLNIPTVIIAIPSLPVEQLTELTNNIQKYTKNILLIPDFKGMALTNTELNHLFFQQLFLLKINNNLKSPLNRFIKRSFDLAVSILFLPLLLPVIGVIGLFIKIDSPGPVFYRHKRIGRKGQAFGVYKFRSMYRDARQRLNTILDRDAEAKREWETYFKIRNDPRVTRMGRFLRKTSLDELPQIFNVLAGQMSLVGPRPVLHEELSKYYKSNADYYFLVRPGITGLWQVSGRNDIDYCMRVKLDSWYILNWSLWLDILMLLKTIKVVVKREGAY